MVDGVHRVVALQAQEPASPYIALWNRLVDFEPADLDRAFAEHAIVKATLFRITLHAVEAADYAAFHAAMTRTLRAARLNDARFRRTGLSPADADMLMRAVLEFASTPRTNAEGEAWLDERLGVTPRPGVWWAFRQFAPLWHKATGGPWSFGPRPSYVTARPAATVDDGAAAMQHLVRRYLEGFGPATIQDIAQFTTILRPPARDAVSALRDSLVRLDGPNGDELFDVPDGLLPDEETPAPPRLLPMWDSTLLAYVDRSRIIPPDLRKDVIRTNGDVLPTLLIDGHVSGVWRPVGDGIEATAFEKLSDEAWEGLEGEARGLTAFLSDRDPMVYRRYARWWPKLPSAEVRVLR